MWICSNNSNHIYTTHTSNWLCEICGIKGNLISADIDRSTDDGGKVPLEELGEEREVGLCILLMDASGSMTDKAFANSGATRLDLITKSAAQGIFDLKQMTKTDNAYICIMGFDIEVQQILFDTVGNILRKYQGQVEQFEQFLYSRLKKMGNGTNINIALEAAESFARKFQKKAIPHFQDYSVMIHKVMKKDGSTINIPNIRVLIYTDGQHNTGDKTEVYNPFKDWTPDVLMGAYFGGTNDTGNIELKKILGECPIHGVLQHFVFDNPTKIRTLRHLFRMASSTSGFCPKCLVI